MKNCITCKTLFEPIRPWQFYCTIKCRRRSPTEKRRTQGYQKIRKDFINKIKMDKGCSKCGYKNHAAALDFNHVHGDKKFNISQDSKVAMDKLLAEIEKCEILCANCHRIHTFENRHWQANRKDRNVNPVA
jgi:hypothetical protein